jgi:hypothetical protein
MFTAVFGGAVIYPAGQSYLSLTFSVNQTLAWPIEQQVGGNVVSSIMDLNATASSLTVSIPDARQVSNGIQSVFNNVGANSIDILDSTGGVIVSVAAGVAQLVYLRDNSTAAGLWRIFQLGAGTSTADAASLVGAGLQANGSTLEQIVAPSSTAVTPITWVTADRATLTIWTGGAGVLNLPSPGTVGSNWFAMIRNSGTGELTITPPSGTIDGAATLGLSQTNSAVIITDGTNFFTVGLGQSATFEFDFVSIDIAGSGDFTLSGTQLNRISYNFTGVLTANRTIIVPATTQQYWLDNSTTGAFSLFAKVTGGSTIEIPQGGSIIAYSNGTELIDATTGKASADITLIAGNGIDPAGLGDLSANRTIATLSATESVEGTAEIATQAETDAGTNDVTIVTPLKLATNLIGVLSVTKIKTGDTSRNTDIVLSDDPQLLGWILEDDTRYLIEGFIAYVQDVGNFQMALQFSDAPQDALLDFEAMDSTGANISEHTPDATSAMTIIAIVDAADAGINLKGYIRSNAGTGGTMDFQWAQQTSDANDTTVKEGSWIRLTKS